MRGVIFERIRLATRLFQDLARFRQKEIAPEVATIPDVVSAAEEARQFILPRESSDFH